MEHDASNSIQVSDRLEIRRHERQAAVQPAARVRLDDCEMREVPAELCCEAPRSRFDEGVVDRWHVLRTR